MKRRRVKITGIGLVTPAGIGRESFVKGILENVSRVSKIARFPSEAGPFVAAEIKRFNIADYGFDAKIKRLPRHTQLALVAARLALSDVRLNKSQVQELYPAIVTGTSLMDSEVINRTIENVALKGPRYGLSRVVFHGPVSSIAAAIAEEVGGARTLALQSACCSGSDAIGHAAELVARGETDIAICGGTEAPISYHPMLELKAAGLSPSTVERPEELSRPFDLWRTTGVIGEGACMLLLEPETSRRQGYAFVSGYAYATDFASGAERGLLEAIRLCVASAGVNPSEIDMISAWGPGHREIDRAEVQSLRRYFGSHLDYIPTVSLKGAIGIPFAAAGAIQAGCAALGMQREFIPPTVNWCHPDPECRLNLSRSPRFLRTEVSLVNAHGLSGTNSCLLLQRCT